VPCREAAQSPPPPHRPTAPIRLDIILCHRGLAASSLTRAARTGPGLSAWRTFKMPPTCQPWCCYRAGARERRGGGGSWAKWERGVAPAGRISRPRCGGACKRLHSHRHHLACTSTGPRAGLETPLQPGQPLAGPGETPRAMRGNVTVEGPQSPARERCNSWRSRLVADGPRRQRGAAARAGRRRF
jgi:hypothetical protein